MDVAERERVVEDVLREYSQAVVLTDPSRLEVWEEMGLTMSQLRVLHHLNRQPGMTAGTLAERLGVRPSTVTGIVDRLVRHGLVERQADLQDRRVVRNNLTTRGAEVVTDISRAGRMFVTNILDRLADESLVELQRVLGGLNEEAVEMGLLPRPAGAAMVAEAP
jgi:DNA-binding MarR family transcriptional regulator